MFRLAGILEPLVLEPLLLNGHADAVPVACHRTTLLHMLFAILNGRHGTA